MTTQSEIIARAKRRNQQLVRRRRDPRYQRVLGRYVAAGLLRTNEDVVTHRDPIAVRDALWAGAIEPRILELLPALIVKRPSLFLDADHLPEDLRAAVAALRRNAVPETFRGIPGPAVARWLPSVGHKGKLPSQLKAFRLQTADLELLNRLCHELGITQTAVVRRGLLALARQQLDLEPQ